MDIIGPDKDKKMIKKYFGIAAAVLFVFLILLMIQRNVKSAERYIPSELQTDDRKDFELTVPDARLRECRNYEMGLKFVCDFGWEEIRTGVDAVVYRIETDPAVRFKIVKFNIDILYIQQLSKDRLEAIGQYVQGFAVEDTEVAGFKAIKIKAFSKENPDTRVLDYYFVRDEETLYALMFSVTPKARWDGYKFVFQKIVDSFAFR